MSIPALCVVGILLLLGVYFCVTYVNLLRLEVRAGTVRRRIIDYAAFRFMELRRKRSHLELMKQYASAVRHFNARSAYEVEKRFQESMDEDQREQFRSLGFEKQWEILESITAETDDYMASWPNLHIGRVMGLQPHALEEKTEA